jgi:SAM-dependent methyltransferase
LQIGRITVSDMRADRLERLRGQLGSQGGFQIEPWDRVNAEFRSSFDLVIGCGLLQGCPTPAEALSRIRDLLVDEGSLVFAEPLPSIFNDLRHIADLSRADATAAGEAPAFQASNDLLERLVAEAGLGSVRVASLKAAATDALLVTAVRERASSRTETGDRAAFASRQMAIIDSDASAFGTALQRIGGIRPRGRPAGRQRKRIRIRKRKRICRDRRPQRSERASWPAGGVCPGAG